jgi:hypothetical protein
MIPPLLNLPPSCLGNIISFLSSREILFSETFPWTPKMLAKDPKNLLYGAYNQLHQERLRLLTQDIDPQGKKESLTSKLFFKIFQTDLSSLTIYTPDIFLKIKMLWKVCHIYSEQNYRADPRFRSIILSMDARKPSTSGLG